MFNKKFLILAAACVSLLAFGFKAQAACQATINVTVKDYAGNAVKGVRFNIVEQLADASGKAVSGKNVGSGTIDQSTGLGVVAANLTSVSKYAVQIVNPSFNGWDYWYFDQLNLSCGQAASFDASLSSVKLKVTDTQGVLQKNIRYALYTQGFDANGQIIKDKSVGGGTTGDAGEAVFYLPKLERTLSGKPGSYMLEITNQQGLKFYYYDLSVADGLLKQANYQFSDLLVYAVDALSGGFLPNIKLGFYTRILSKDGSYQPDKLIQTLTTNDQGWAYIQYPAGSYILQYTKNGGAKVNFDNIVIGESRRSKFNVAVADAMTAQCSLKSALALSFRDFDAKIIGNLNYSIFIQDLDDDGIPIAGVKAAGGRVNANGKALSDFYPQTNQHYLLQVCGGNYKFGCYWFKDITFACRQNLSLSKTLKSVDIILRKTNGALAVGQNFKIYRQEKDVDGQPVIDQDNLIGQFKIPASGKIRAYLDNKELNGENLDYLLVVNIDGKDVFAPFSIAEGKKTALEYAVANPLKPYKKPAIIKASVKKK